MMFTLPETNIAPENAWLEYDRFLLGLDSSYCSGVVSILTVFNIMKLKSVHLFFLGNIHTYPDAQCMACSPTFRYFWG